MYAKTLVKSSFMFCLRQANQQLFVFLQMRENVEQEVRWGDLGFQSSDPKFEFDFRFALVDCPTQL